MTDSTQTVLDSPVGWVASHIRTYLESGGAKGHHFRGTDSLLLTTRGRKSGRLRRTALYYGRDGGAYLVIASHGGSSKHPLWYLNLRDHPLVELAALALGVWRKVHPFAILAGGAVLGAAGTLVGGA